MIGGGWEGPSPLAQCGQSWGGIYILCVGGGDFRRTEEEVAA